MGGYEGGKALVDVRGGCEEGYGGMKKAVDAVRGGTYEEGCVVLREGVDDVGKGVNKCMGM